MTEPTPEELWAAWRDAVRQAKIGHAICALYGDVDQAIRDAPRDLPLGPPTCNASGRCCNFKTYGHRLYVTGLEITWFLDRVSGTGFGVSDAPPSASGEPSSLALPVIEPGGDAPRATGPTPDPEPKTHAVLPDACRYQADGLCSTHVVRPLGCRVYFCTPGTDDWQHAVYERFLDRLRTLHTEHALPYRYMEWRTGLIEADRWRSKER